MPAAARRPWLTLVLWFLVLTCAAPLVGQVTAHLGSGGFAAPGGQAVYADATAARLAGPAALPSTLVAGPSRGTLASWARATGVPVAWLHPLGPQSTVVVPTGRTPALRPFLALARRHGAELTPVTDSRLGQAVSQTAIQAFTASTVVAVPALLVLLWLVFGTVPAALLPFVTAGAGTIVALAVVAVVERYVPLSVYLLQIVTFLALGVGVDYALFLSSRFRLAVEAGAAPDAALAESLRTSGRSVLFSGLAVALALAALVLGGTAYWRGMALGGAVAVASVLLVTHTLLPALLRLLGRRVSTGRIPFAMPEWRLWPVLARFATARPLPALLVGLGILVAPALAAPAVRADIPANVAAMLPQDAPLARAVRLEQAVLGPGRNFPFVVAITLDRPVTSPRAWQAVAVVTRRLAALPDVAVVASPTSGAVPAAALAGLAARPGTPLAAFVSAPHVVDLFVTAKSGPDAPATLRLLDAMQRTLAHVPGARVAVGGSVAVMQEFDRYLMARLPAMALAVTGIALGVLLLATGSLVQAAVGVALNALVTLATGGVLVWIIQRGLFGVTPEPLNLAVAPLVFVLLFGLSMDYEVILLHRIQERLARGEPAAQAATRAGAATGGMITGAGLIMVACVAALLVSPFEILRTLAIGLVSAVILDTLVVRTFLVPAVVTLLGERAFWPWRARPSLARPLG